MLQKLSGVLSAQIAGESIAFVVAPGAGFDTFAVTASTHLTVVESTTLADGTLLSNVREDSIADGALGFAGLTTGVPDASGAFAAVAADATTPDGEVEQVSTAGEAVTETVTTSLASLTLVMNQASAQLDLAQGNVGDNDDLLDLVADLNGQIAASALAGLVKADLQGDRVRFTTTGIGIGTSLLIFGQRSFSVGATTTFDDGFALLRDLGGGQTFSALGFDEVFAIGTDRSYLVAEVPFPGWSPTVGAMSTPEGMIGRQPVLFGEAGQIIEGVDFGNILVAGFDLGEDFDADEGELVMLAPAITDPLGREGDPYDYLWQVEADNGDIVAGGTEAAFSFTPHDNGTYVVRLFVTDVERGLAAYPDEVVITAHNVAPALEAGAGQSVFEGELVSIEPLISDAGILATHRALIAWGDGTTTVLGSL
ncbi:MAG TPA: hypothetical protein VLA56_00150, partial [Pseudomonadales bacterium]|nr:hypothetical protein [Pseudomonadales bacterium]